MYVFVQESKSISMVIQIDGSVAIPRNFVGIYSFATFLDVNNTEYETFIII